MGLAKAAAVMTPADQASQQLKAPYSVRRRQRGGRSVLQVSSSVSAMEALRARIRAQSKTVAEHIAADPDAKNSSANGPHLSPMKADQQSEAESMANRHGRLAQRSRRPRSRPTPPRAQQAQSLRMERSTS